VSAVPLRRGRARASLAAPCQSATGGEGGELSEGGRRVLGAGCVSVSVCLCLYAWMFHTPYPHTLPGRVWGMQKGMYPGMVSSIPSIIVIF